MQPEQEKYIPSTAKTPSGIALGNHHRSSIEIFDQERTPCIGSEVKNSIFRIASAGRRYKNTILDFQEIGFSNFPDHTLWQFLIEVKSFFSNKC